MVQLTFAGLYTLAPRMNDIFVADISALLEPSTTASATTGFPRLLRSTALGTPLVRRACFCEHPDDRMAQKTQESKQSSPIDRYIVLFRAVRQVYLQW